MQQHPEILVQARRGGTVESVHRVVAAVAGSQGEMIECWGDPRTVTFWRSSAKPLQAQGWLADGTVDHFGWGARELAIMSASHGGLGVQADIVRRMLADIGLTEADLRCDRGLGARHTCSGNHAGFLAACVYHGWDVPTYREPRHPAQEAALRAFCAGAGLEAGQVITGVDGCGIVTYASSVAVAARTFALLPGLLPEVSAAMRDNPALVEGPSGIDTLVMESIPGATSKFGAEGLNCISLPGGHGLAVRVVDGASRAQGPATMAILGTLLDPGFANEALAALSRPPIRNDSGDVVGELVAML